MTVRVRHLVSVAGAAAIMILGAAALANAQTKEAQGAVTAVSDTSITIASAGRPMTFVVDKNTTLEVKAAAQKSRAAKATDTPGVTITQYVKTGTPVVIRYQEANGVNRALFVRPVSSAGDGSAPEAAAKIADGTVKAVSLSQLTLDSGGKDLTFAINGDTDVLARGATKTTKAAGGKTTIADFVHNGDTVSITYHESGGTRTASQVRLRIANK
jgi:hypothetical protein